MAIIFADPKLRLALSGVRAVKSKAQTIQSLSGTFTFDTLRDAVDQMNRAFQGSTKPLIDTYDAAAIQTAFGASGIFNAPANARSLMVNVGNAVSAFNTAYAALYAGAGNVMTFDAGVGVHAFVSFQVSALASLSAPITTILTACALLDYED